MNVSKLKFVLLLLIVLLVLSAKYANASELKLYSTMGYPYKLLLTRSEEIKIIYSEIADKVTCRVEILENGRRTITQNVEAKSKHFNEKPLASCLPRNEAKKLLAQTF